MSAIRSSTSALKSRLQAVASHGRANVSGQRLMKTSPCFGRELISPFIFPYEREVMTAKNIFNKSGEPFVKETRILDNFLEQSSRIDLENTFSDKPIFLLHHRLSCGKMCLTAVDASLSPKHDICPFPPLSRYECCNSSSGLFSFHSEDGSIFIWNPARCEFKIFPPPAPFLDPSPLVIGEMISSGIWVDTESQDYKVMRFFIAHREDESEYLEESKHEIEMYSHKTDSWKKISFPEIGMCEPLGVCINGVFYIKACTEKKNPPFRNDLKSIIFSLDFSTETPSILPTPPIDTLSVLLLNYNGMLGLLAYDSKPSEYEKLYQLWVMRDGIWDLVSHFNVCGVEDPIGCSRNGQLLCFKSLNGNKLLVFDSATGKLFKCFDCACPDGVVEPILSSESPIELKGGIEYQIPVEHKGSIEYMI